LSKRVFWGRALLFELVIRVEVVDGCAMGFLYCQVLLLIYLRVLLDSGALFIKRVLKH
jgi:hypothetical protein